MLLCTLNICLTLPWNLIWYSGRETMTYEDAEGIYLCASRLAAACKQWNYTQSWVTINMLIKYFSQPVSLFFLCRKQNLWASWNVVAVSVLMILFFLSVLGQIRIWFPVLAPLRGGARSHSSGSSLEEKHQLTSHCWLICCCLLHKMLLPAQC